MKKIGLLFGIVFVCQYLTAQPIRKLKIEELLKEIESTTTPVVINFWATWCGPCIREIPWFEKNVALFANEKLKLILVSIDFPDEYPKNIQAFANKNGYRSEIIWLNETNADEFCPKLDSSWQGAIPATLMVNNKKHYRQFYNGQLPEGRLLLELKKLVE
jgi:thiol-disulfide isomerase/thioredoxin